MIEEETIEQLVRRMRDEALDLAIANSAAARPWRVPPIPKVQSVNGDQAYGAAGSMARDDGLTVLDALSNEPPQD
jgi:hypothetical protein